MASNKILFFLIIISLSAWVINSESSLEYRCSFHNQREITHTGMCEHGARKNTCDRLTCLRGVGDKCGENFALQVFYGECADGLQCCETCIGCRNGICNHRMCPPKRSFTHAYNVIQDNNY